MCAEQGSRDSGYYIRKKSRRILRGGIVFESTGWGQTWAEAGFGFGFGFTKPAFLGSRLWLRLPRFLRAWLRLRDFQMLWLRLPGLPKLQLANQGFGFGL